MMNALPLIWMVDYLGYVTRPDGHTGVLGTRVAPVEGGEVMVPVRLPDGARVHRRFRVVKVIPRAHEIDASDEWAGDIVLDKL